MKTKDLTERFECNGWTFKRYGANYDIYVKGNERESAVRRKDMDEKLVSYSKALQAEMATAQS